MPCDFCSPEAVEAQVVAVVGPARLWLPRTPLTAGTLIATPGRHVERFAELTHEDTAGLLDAAQAATRVAGELFGTVACNFALNDGPEAGQSTPHVHLHIWPRTPDRGFNPFKVLNGLDGAGPRMGTPEWEQLLVRWRAAFSQATARG